jgi:hypothetical protein
MFESWRIRLFEFYEFYYNRVEQNG